MICMYLLGFLRFVNFANFLIPHWNTEYLDMKRNYNGHFYRLPPAPPHKTTLRLHQNHSPTLPKSCSDLTKIILRLYQNHTPILPKSHSDFTKITLRLYQNHWLVLTKSYSDFTKIKPWLCLKPPIPSYNYIFKIKWKHQPNTYLSPSFSML